MKSTTRVKLVQKIYEKTSNPDGSIDFVGSEQSFDTAFNSIKRGGSCVITGLFGGKLQLPLPYLLWIEFQ